ncbi:hypothetical protein ABT095_34535 [Kitasatospora sp. NPDC002227]|uniref:hypothetical protein n=1 Tax=Kitasatospora sp. NPDC002227 TaxID=3154773 RepID=UPI003321537F
MKKLAITARVVTALAIAAGASLAGVSSASASTGGGCRAWAVPVANVGVQPCISASGTNINASLYLSGSRPLYSAWIDLYVLNPQNKWIFVAEKNEYCHGGAAGNCSDLNNVTFGYQPPGAYLVEEGFHTSDGLQSGGLQSPIQYLN